jgi:hypothetical protein
MFRHVSMVNKKANYYLKEYSTAEAPDRLENLTLEKLHSIMQEQGIQAALTKSVPLIYA